MDGKGGGGGRQRGINDQVVVFLVVEFIIESEAGIEVILKAIVGHGFLKGGFTLGRGRAGGERRL